MSLWLRLNFYYSSFMNQDFPNKIPVFPLSGVIYFPNTSLPLNIFEKRYLDLVEDCMKNDKFMGMVQSVKGDEQLYDVGCLGKIENFKKTQDGRVLVNLSGLSRFEIINEISNSKLYREFEVKYKRFDSDLITNAGDNINTKEMQVLLDKAKIFFRKSGLLLNWKELERLPHNQQIDTLAMISPVSNEEKQKLLETITPLSKIKILSEIIEFYLLGDNYDNYTIQ